MWIKNSNELYHGGKKGMKWGYNDGKRNGKRTAGSILDEYNHEPPEGYNPAAFGEWKPSTLGGKKGFVDENGIFYEGDSKTATKKKYNHDLLRKDREIRTQLAERRRKKSISYKVDQLVEDAKVSKKRLGDVSKNMVNNGRNKVAELLRSAADKLEDKPKSSNDSRKR